MSFRRAIRKSVQESKSYRDHSCKILKPFIGEAFPETKTSVQKDLWEHIDLEGPLGTAGVRVRSADYFYRYRGQFTIRSQTHSESKHQDTKEIESVLAGNLKYYLCGWSVKKWDGVIFKYHIIYVPNLLKCIEKHGLENVCIEKCNDDGSRFLVFDPANPKMLGFGIMILFMYGQSNLIRRSRWERLSL